MINVNDITKRWDEFLPTQIELKIYIYVKYWNNITSVDEDDYDDDCMEQQQQQESAQERVN